MGDSSYRKLIAKFSKKTEKQNILFASIAIVVLFIILVYTVYIAPIGIDKLYILLLFVFFWYSKADYFWFAFFLIVTATPAGFFTDTTADAIRRLPLFSIMPKVSFSVLDIFLILALIKAFVKGKKVNYIDVFKLKNILYIIPFILIVSIFYGITLKLFLNATARGLFFYTLIFSFPSLICNKKAIYKFMILFFPFVFFELAAQVFWLQTGIRFVNFLNPGTLPAGYNPVTEDFRVIASGYIMLRLLYVFAFILLDNRENLIPRSYTITVILVSLFSIIMSETRAAITMFIFIFIMYFIFIARKKPNLIMQISITIVIVIFLLDFINVFSINDIFGGSYERYVSAVSIEEGTVRPEDTFDYRISVRLPKLIETIKNSVFVGYGLSDNYYEYYDVHLGGLPVGLLQAGIIGYSAYLLFIFNIFKKSFSYIKKFSKDNTFITPIKVFIIGFFGYAIINFTVDPIFVLNTSTSVQDILIHFIVASIMIYLAMREEAIKKIELKTKLNKELNLLKI